MVDLPADSLPTALAQSASYLSADDQQLLLEAYVFAKDAHEGMMRKSGEPFITHPVAVAVILAEMQMDSEALLAGLLHDTVEDTDATFEQVESKFGRGVRVIVEGETKISKLAVRVYEDEQAENLRQMLLAMVNDVRIIIVKLADRLHNMRTLQYMTRAKQLRIAEETLEIFAPLAHRLGINHIKGELEDLSFKFLEPDRYRQLERQVRMRHAERQAHVEQSIALLSDRLSAEGLTFELSGRSKHLYSIYTKMQRDNRNLDQIFDLMAIRAILDSDSDNAQANLLTADDQAKAVCYRALGIVHSLWTPIPGRFKDYVAVPKPNGYQSLHTTVIGLKGQPIEVQIRTKNMHEVAEFGVAAHWAYKAGMQRASDVEDRLEWMKQLLDVDDTSESAGSFVDAVKTDILSERVIVFTPAGDSINMPFGSTPIDFAYHVHTEVGHRCIGARVNGEIVPLSHPLNTGDRVEILTNRSSQYGPSKDWLNIVTTRGAKQKIRHYFRLQERQLQLEAGKRSLERGLRRRSLPVAKNMTKAKLEPVAKKLLNTDSIDDLYLALDSGRITPKAIVNILAPEVLEPAQETQPAKKRPAESLLGIFVDGIDAPAKLAQCCSPVRGDEVIGYVTRGRGLTVHRLDCPNVKHLMQSDAQRFVTVTWDPHGSDSFPVDFEVVAIDRPGLLKDLLDVLDGLKKSAMRVNADVSSSGAEAKIQFRVEVRDQEEVDLIRSATSRIPDVREVFRNSPGVRG